MKNRSVLTIVVEKNWFRSFITIKLFIYNGEDSFLSINFLVNFFINSREINFTIFKMFYNAVAARIVSIETRNNKIIHYIKQWK
mgnify:CR=1 FL=1